jgi:predicted PurR-regulated permease PerM
MYGVVIAYVLNKIMKLYENKVFFFLNKKPGKMRMKRTISIICTYITFVAIIAGFIWLIGPQIIEGLKDLRYQMPLYIESLEAWLLELSEENETLHDLVFDIFAYVNGLMDKFGDIMVEIMPQITAWISQLVTFLKDLAIGIILSVYFLAQKEKFVAMGKRVARALFADNKYNGAISLMKQIDNSFGGYLVAMGVDCVLVMVECLVIFGLFEIPYYPLVSFIIGVTNFIPFFGPFIGAIPSAFIIFIVDPIKVLIFIVLIVIIQQIDGNVIAPRIIGSHLGISSVWVVIAVTIMSGFFGFVGMIIGVPLFSVIYTLVDNAIARKLEEKNCDTDILDFYSDGNIGKTMELELMDIEMYRATKVPLHKRIFAKFKKNNKEIVHDYYDDDIFSETFETEVYKDEEDFLAHTSELGIKLEEKDETPKNVTETKNTTEE